MQKPKNYDNTAATGEFTPVELGGHYMTIKKMREQKNKNGGDMLVVLFDFATDDKQAGYFMNQFKADIRPEKKWPNNGTKYFNVEDNNGNCSKMFKGFVTSVEASNPGFKVSWGADFCTQFIGKTVGGVFGEVENEYNGKVTMRHDLRWFCGSDKVRDAKIPSPVYLDGKAPRNAAAAKPVDNSFVNAQADTDDDEIPFD